MALTDQQLGNIGAAAGLLTSIGSSMATEAAGINQQTGYMLNAINTLAIANVRADQEERYSAIQAGRTLQRAQMESLNYKMAGNALIRNLEKTNAAARARAAANGVAYNEGSAAFVQDANTRNTFKDVGVTDYNALMARVLGFEDATAMMTNGEIQAELTRTSARMQAQQYNVAADSSVRTAGLLANAKLTEGITDFAKTFKW
jgi:hypothetical protein